MELGGRGREGLHGQGSGGLGAAPHGAVQGQRVLLLALQGDSGLQPRPRPGSDAPQPPGPSTGPPASPHSNGTGWGILPWAALGTWTGENTWTLRSSPSATRPNAGPYTWLRTGWMESSPSEKDLGDKWDVTWPRALPESKLCPRLIPSMGSR